MDDIHLRDESVFQPVDDCKDCADTTMQSQRQATEREFQRDQQQQQQRQGQQQQRRQSRRTQSQLMGSTTAGPGGDSAAGEVVKKRVKLATLDPRRQPSNVRQPTTFKDFITQAEQKCAQGKQLMAIWRSGGMTRSILETGEKGSRPWKMPSSRLAIPAQPLLQSKQIMSRKGEERVADDPGASMRLVASDDEDLEDYEAELNRMRISATQDNWKDQGDTKGLEETWHGALCNMGWKFQKELLWDHG
ncbi:hypothetical protein B0O80DRAFT_503829 [Mortierella sp. GBAus27b]|nr:hypothetical protein B0O80DRAFT_503829 [Mortierella sp. GBAus27b]